MRTPRFEIPRARLLEVFSGSNSYVVKVPDVMLCRRLTKPSGPQKQGQRLLVSSVLPRGIREFVNGRRFDRFSGGQCRALRDVLFHGTTKLAGIVGQRG